MLKRVQHDDRVTGGLMIAVAGVIAVVAPAWLLWPAADHSGTTKSASSRLVISAGRPLDAALNRPLFAEAPTAAEPEADLQSADVTPPELVGIVGRLPDAAVALVRTSDGSSRTLAIGDSVDGWRLGSLARDAAYFVRGSERVRIALPLQ